MNPFNIKTSFVIFSSILYFSFVKEKDFNFFKARIKFYAYFVIYSSSLIKNDSGYCSYINFSLN